VSLLCEDVSSGIEPFVCQLARPRGELSPALLCRLANGLEPLLRDLTCLCGEHLAATGSDLGGHLKPVLRDVGGASGEILPLARYNASLRGEDFSISVAATAMEDGNAHCFGPFDNAQRFKRLGRERERRSWRGEPVPIDPSIAAKASPKVADEVMQFAGTNAAAA